MTTYPRIYERFKARNGPWIVARTAGIRDQLVVEQFAREESEAVGFCNRSGYTNRINRGNVVVLIAQGSPVGFCMFGGLIKSQHVRISQLVIDRSIRRRGVATQIIRLIRSQNPNKPTIASIRQGLPMNRRAKATGAFLAQVIRRQTVRKKPLNVWIWPPLAKKHLVAKHHRASTGAS